MRMQNFFWRFFIFDLFSSGSSHGSKTSGKEVWYQRCEFETNLSLQYHFYSMLSMLWSVAQVVHWMKSTDTDNDGKLSYKEFNRSLKEFLKITADDNEEEEKWFSLSFRLMTADYKKLKVANKYELRELFCFCSELQRTNSVSPFFEKLLREWKCAGATHIRHGVIKVNCPVNLFGRCNLF